MPNITTKVDLTEESPERLKKATRKEIQVFSGKPRSLVTAQKNISISQATPYCIYMTNQMILRCPFTASQRTEIAYHLIHYTNIFFGLPLDVARKLAYQCAVRLKIPNIPNDWKYDGLASKAWVELFSLEYPVVRFKPWQMTVEQSKENINRFLSMYYQFLEKYKFKPSSLYKLISISLSRYVYPEQKNVNMEIAVSAAGELVCQLFVKAMSEVIPLELRGVDLQKFMSHLINKTQPKPSDPVMLLLEQNHMININVEVIEMARANSVILLAVPPHFKDEMNERLASFNQLATSVASSFKIAQNQWSETYSTQDDLLEIFKRVQPSKSYIEKIFRESGLWPFNPNIIVGGDFVPSVTGKLKYYDLQHKESEKANMMFKPQAALKENSQRENISNQPNKLKKHRAETVVSGISHTGNPKIAQPGSSADGQRAEESENIDTVSIDSSEDFPESLVTLTPLCRFCAEFTEDCIDVTKENKPYLTGNSLNLAINDTSVELHFDSENDLLPKTVCRACDSKLLEIYNFIKKVKSAQYMINQVYDVNEDNSIERTEPTAEDTFADINKIDEIETIEIIDEIEDNKDEIEDNKYEIEVNKDEIEVNKDEIEDNKDEIEDIKDGIVDSITITETTFVKPTGFIYTRGKRKIYEVDAPLKPEVSKDVKDSLIVELKEEYVEMDDETQEMECEASEHSDRETDMQPNVAKRIKVNVYDRDSVGRSKK